MKYKAELEFEVHAYGEDKELSEKELISKAKYAMDRGIYKWSDLICDTIGFPGDMGVKSVSIVNEEPVSEELNAAGKEWLRPQLDKSYANYGEVKMMELTHFDGYAMLDAIEFGAKWQKQQMMKDAVDATIGLPYENKDGGYTHLVDVSRLLPVGNNKIAVIFKEK